MRSALLTASVLVLTACATVRTGGVQSVSFTSDPPGATVETSTGERCAATPCTLELDRATAFTALFRLGDEVRIVEVESVTAGEPVATNLLVAGGLLGLGVDAASGALFELTPSPVAVTFAGAGSGAGAASGTDLASAETAPEEETSEAPAAAAPSTAVGKPLFEGSPMAFTETELAAFCAEPWTTRVHASGRTEYNPCRAPEAFR